MQLSNTTNKWLSFARQVAFPPTRMSPTSRPVRIYTSSQPTVPSSCSCLTCFKAFALSSGLWSMYVILNQNKIDPFLDIIRIVNISHRTQFKILITLSQEKLNHISMPILTRIQTSSKQTKSFKLSDNFCSFRPSFRWDHLTLSSTNCLCTCWCDLV